MVVTRHDETGDDETRDEERTPILLNVRSAEATAGKYLDEVARIMLCALAGRFSTWSEHDGHCLHVGLTGAACPESWW